MARLLWILLLSGCYQAHERALDAGLFPADAGADAAVRLCGCPGAPTAHVCVLPLMCCPATETCEDPAHFNCSGHDPCR